MNRFMLIAVVAAGVFSLELGRADIVGSARVIDGDSLVVGGVMVRLHGADAFERGQVCGNPPWPCGKAATAAMRELVTGRTVACEGLYRSYDRVAAVCHVGEIDLAGELVRRGLAVAVERFSRAYLLVEKQARQAKVGAWAGSFIMPARWRRQ